MGRFNKRLLPSFNGHRWLSIPTLSSAATTSFQAQMAVRLCFSYGISVPLYLHWEAVGLPKEDSSPEISLDSSFILIFYQLGYSLKNWVYLGFGFTLTRHLL